MSRILSGSALTIAAACGWAYRESSIYPEVPRDEAASDGDTVHANIQARLTPGMAVPSIRPELMMKARQAVDWLRAERIVPMACEAAYAFRPSDRSVRHLGDNINREYEKHGLDQKNEIPLTVDLVGRRWDGTYVVVDWKSEHLEGHLEPAEDSLQLGLAAYCVAKLVHARTVEAVYAFTAADQVRTDWVRHNGMSLLRVLGRTDQAWANSKRNSLPVDGEHCRYCPALGACPKTKESLGALPEGQGITWTTEYVSDENDAKMVQSITAMEKAIENIREALKARALEKGGIYLGNGKVWKQVVSQRTTFDKRKAEELLGERIAECTGKIEVAQFRQVKP